MNATGVIATEDDVEKYHKRQHHLEVIKTLGEGTHGKVVLATNLANSRQFAVKMLTKKNLNKSKEKFHIQREIDIHSKLRHPHIITVYEVYETESTVTMVMEYASGGELFDYINARVTVDSQYSGFAGGLSESEARLLFRQLVSAVQYLHENGIVHRDLKLENILMDSRGNTKLADFGLSTTFGHGHLLKTYCGSPLYASPEIVNARPYAGPEVDCWSLGVLLYAMIYGTMPFDGHDFRTLRRQISDGLVQRPPLLSGAHDLILHILEPSLPQRATLQDIVNDPWVRDEGGQDSDCICPPPPPQLEDRPCGDGMKPNGENRTRANRRTSMPETCTIRPCSSRENCRSVSQASVGACADSTPARQRCVSAPNISDLQPANVANSSRSVCGKVVARADDYIPLCDKGDQHGQSFSHVDLVSGDNFPDPLVPCGVGSSALPVLRSRYGNGYSSCDSATHASEVSRASKLSTGFSEDSLELSVNGDVGSDPSESDEEGFCSERNHCSSYNLADIDAVLNDTAVTSFIADPASDVSSDSLNEDDDAAL